MVEAQPIDEIGDVSVLAVLREDRADIPRRNLEIVAGGLTVEVWLEVEVLLLDDLENTLLLPLLARVGSSWFFRLSAFRPPSIFRCLGNLLGEGAVLLIDDAALLDDVGSEEQGQHGNDGDTGTHDAEIAGGRLVPLYFALLLGGVETGGVEVRLALLETVVEGGRERLLGIVQTEGLDVAALGLGGHGAVAEDGGILGVYGVALLAQARLLFVVDGQHLVVLT